MSSELIYFSVISSLGRGGANVYISRSSLRALPAALLTRPVGYEVTVPSAQQPQGCLLSSESPVTLGSQAPAWALEAVSSRLRCPHHSLLLVTLTVFEGHPFSCTVFISWGFSNGFLLQSAFFRVPLRGKCLLSRPAGAGDSYQ